MKRRYAAIPFLTPLLIAYLWLSSISGLTLMLVSPETGEVLYSAKVSQGDRIILSYTHSIYRIAVREEFLVHNSSLVLTRITMGDGATTETLDQESAFMLGGSVVLVGQSRSVVGFRLRVGEVGRPTLDVGDSRIDLAGLVGVGNSVELRLRPG